MFGSEKRLEKRLRETGANAPAVVLAARRVGSEIRHRQRFEIWRLDLKVRPVDADAFDARTKSSIWIARTPRPGNILHVLYDPSDHSHVMIDTECTDVAPPPGWHGELIPTRSTNGVDATLVLANQSSVGESPGGLPVEGLLSGAQAELGEAEGLESKAPPGIEDDRSEYAMLMPDGTLQPVGGFPTQADPLNR